MRRFLVLLAVVWSAFADQSDPRNPLELQAQSVLRDFDLRGDAKTLFENVAHAYGLQCVFDADYPAGESFRFQLEHVEYRTALHALEEATRSFVVPVSAKSFLVAKDSPEKRNAIEPFVAMTVEIPQATTPQELTEVVTAVQQVLAIEKLGVQTQGDRVVLRGPISKIVPARELFDSLIHYRPQVSIELQLLEINQNDTLAFGLDLPTTFSIVNLNTLASGGTPLAGLAKRVWGGTAFGIAFASAQAIAQMQKSHARSLMDFEVRASNHQTATFHSGDRYPVVTSQYVAGPTPGSSGDGSTPAQPSVFGNVAHPSAVVTVDLNRDGVPDVAAASSEGNAVAVLLGNTDGSFGNATLFTTGSSPSAIAAVDLDGDGITDLITADAQSDSVSVLIGKGDGSFREAVHFGVGARPVAVAVADFNRDGFVDIATANADSNDVSILLGHGDGTFAAAQSWKVDSVPQALIAVDLNADNIADIVSVNSQSNDVSVLLGIGDGGFRPAVAYATGRTPVAIAADDLNRDGKIDLAVANSGDGTVSVLAGDGTGAFTTGVSFPAGTRPVAIGIADFNLDSAKDLMVANPDDGALSMLLGLGNGSFQAPVAFHTGTQPDSLAITDVNKDSLADVIAGNSSTNNFSLLLGTVTGSFHDTSGNNLNPTGGQTYAPPPSFNFEDLGLVVKVTPHVHGMNEVSLDLDAEVKMLTGTSLSNVPVISNRKLATQVRVPNGQWTVIAGLLSKSDAYTITGLPLVPIPGRRQRDRTDTRILVLIKTTLLSLPAEEYVNLPVPLGSETRPRAPR